MMLRGVGVGSHVGVRARGKGGDFCVVGGWANGKERRVFPLWCHKMTALVCRRRSS